MSFRRSRKTYTEPELYEYAVGALSRKMRSVAELKRLLRQRSQDEPTIDRVINRLKDQKYLNDSAYAAAYSNYRRENEKFGKLRVITDLKTKGVHGDVIGKAVESAYEGTKELDLALAFLRRKRIAQPKNDKEAARIFRTLARAGFTSKTSITILKRWKVEDDLLTALESETEG